MYITIQTPKCIYTEGPKVFFSSTIALADQRPFSRLFFFFFPSFFPFLPTGIDTGYTEWHTLRNIKRTDMRYKRVGVNSYGWIKTKKIASGIEKREREREREEVTQDFAILFCFFLPSFLKPFSRPSPWGQESDSTAEKKKDSFLYAAKSAFLS